MFSRLFGRGPQPAQPLYGAIVAASRRPAFYRDLGVPDTVEGRFDLIVLHLCLLFRRLAAAGAETQALREGVYDEFCRDMDANLREMGVGDLTVPKKMRGFAEAFFGRQRVYDEALAHADDGPLAAALARNVFGESDVGEGARRLALYVRAALRALDAQDVEALAQGRVVFPEPEGAGDEIARPG